MSNRGKELARLTAGAVKSVSPFLMRAGHDDFDIRIDWAKISPQKLAELDAGPGRVGELVEQDPIHQQSPTLRGRQVIATSDQRFIRDASGFSILFLPPGNLFADISRKSSHMRRFHILFPELEEAVMTVVAERAERHSLEDYPFYPRFMRFVYAVLCQLIDSNDLCADGTPVRDSPSGRRMLMC